MIDLATKLPTDRIEMNQGDLPEVLDSDDVPELDRPVGELVRDIVALHRWVGLHNIELDAPYRSLIDECLDPIEPLIQNFQGGMTSREGYVFLSPAKATTPAHVDYEHNFLLQIRGSKEVTVGRIAPDAEQKLLESMHSGGYGRSSETPKEQQVIRLEPGDGMYIAPSLVHLVHTLDDELSVSLSLVFNTKSLERNARVFAANHHVRSLGLTPRSPGQSAASDRLKSGAVLSWRRAKAPLVSLLSRRT